MVVVPFFPNVDIELHEYNGLDEYGDSIYEFREVVKGDMQPLSAQSSMELFGKILQDTYRIFLNKDTPIKHNDLLQIEESQYEIIGSVETWNHIIPYQQITVKKLRNMVEL